MLFIGLGETDEWGHGRRYDLYLDAAHNSDRYPRRPLETLQAMPEYKDKTALVITTDHGRGATRADWTDHGENVPLAEFVWIAVLGPDTPALGVRANVETTQSQIAATDRASAWGRFASGQSQGGGAIAGGAVSAYPRDSEYLIPRIQRQ